MLSTIAVFPNYSQSRMVVFRYSTFQAKRTHKTLTSHSDSKLTTVSKLPLCSPYYTDLGADTIGSVSLHPIHPIALTVSGSRHFGDGKTSSDESSDDDSSDSDSEPEVHRDTNIMTVRDASMKMWGFHANSGKEDNTMIVGV